MEKSKEYATTGHCISILTRRDHFVGVSVWISSELYNKLAELALATGVSPEAHLSIALTRFVETYEVPSLRLYNKQGRPVQ